MKKTVAIIGAVGNIGSPIALGLATAGYRVLLTDDIHNHPLRYMRLPLLESKIRWMVPKADVQLVVSRREASWEADILVAAVPYEEQAEVARRIKDVVTGKIIISLAVPLNESHNQRPIDPASIAAEELARLLPYSKIVRVVSIIFASRPEIQKGSVANVDVFVTGDDKESVTTVVQLVEDAGFHPRVAGTLAMNHIMGDRAEPESGPALEDGMEPERQHSV